MPTTTSAQAAQDIFALSVCGSNGTYIEIGASTPRKNSNTYELELAHGWRGISLESDLKFQQEWAQSKRSNKIYWNNALTFDYVTALKENDLPLTIDYLSCDIDPPGDTFAAIQQIIEQGIVFRCITFEHDKYQRTDQDYNYLATKYLVSKGYKVAVRGVYCLNPLNHFETWFVHNSIEFEPIRFDQWKNKNPFKDRMLKYICTLTRPSKDVPWFRDSTEENRQLVENWQNWMTQKFGDKFVLEVSDFTFGYSLNDVTNNQIDAYLQVFYTDKLPKMRQLGDLEYKHNQAHKIIFEEKTVEI
jgi:hypothetical protein